jgi:hypothetical protein
VSGAYCRYCDHRCFVYRQVRVGGELVWAGHMATCPKGAAHDRRVLGVDHTQAHNPMDPEPRDSDTRVITDPIEAEDPDAGGTVGS